MDGTNGRMGPYLWEDMVETEVCLSTNDEDAATTVTYLSMWRSSVIAGWIQACVGAAVS